jgi:hypothetical protein
MAEATVNVKLKPTQFDLIVQAVQDYYETHNDLLEDPVVKQEDKQIAATEAFAAADILREFGYPVKK